MTQFPPEKSEQVRPEELIKAIKHEPKDQGLKDIPVTPANYRKFEGNNPSRLPRSLLWGVFGLVVLFLGGSLMSFYVFRGRVAGSISENIGTLRSGVVDLQNLDPQSAQQKFSSLGNLSTSDFGSFMNSIGFLFQGGKEAVASFTDLSQQLSTLSQELSTTQASIFEFFVSGQGGTLITDLKQLQGTVNAIDDATGKLSGAASFAGGLSSVGGGDFYLSLTSQVEGAKKFLDAFVPWLSDPGTHHVLVLLQNPSEIRPGGGFLGSYADVTIVGGNISDVSVHDIADVDVAFVPKIIPPKQLQLTVTKWRPADANWFFDFPTTASKTIEFFEGSDLYAKTGTKFDGAIAISPAVVSGLLAVTGPISIGKPTTTFTASAFLVQIQKIVQDGQATSATYPKQILRDLTHALFAKLGTATDEQKKEILAIALGDATKKDIMVYFKDPTLNNFFDTVGVSGAAYQIPQKFNGDYLALVDANVGGGKSDIYVSSTVSYSAQINADGTITNHVVVTRKHNGNRSSYSWYKTTSQDYMQLFIPDATTLTNASGGVVKKFAPPTDYTKGGYISDPLVAALESTEQTIFGYPTIAWHMEGGKKVITTWSTLKAGDSAQISFDYTRRLFLLPADGVDYQFVFEKQAGTARHYQFDINAPLGFVFTQNRLSSYEYVSDDPPGRVIVNLTLQKM